MRAPTMVALRQCATGLSALLLAAALQAAPAPPTDVAAPPGNLVVNGDFRTDANADGVPDGWDRGRGPSVARDGDRAILVLDGTQATTSQTIALRPEWWVLTLTMRMRTTGVVLGDEGWKNARLAMSFHDDKGTRVGEWPNVFNATGTTDWTDCQRAYSVPRGAAKLVLNPANFGTAGKVEFADLRLVVTRSRSLAPEDAPLPEGVTAVWDADRAWRQRSATRELVCLNGLWRFLAAPAAEAAAPPPAVGQGWGWLKVPGIWPAAWDRAESAQDVHPSSWTADSLDARAVDRAWYQREIAVPAGWSGRRVFLEVTMLQTHARVRVDDREAGELWFPGGRLDLTTAVTPGRTHLLSVLVTARPLDTETAVFMAPERVLRDQADVKLKGLTGDVFLSAEPAASAIRDVHVVCSTRQGRVTFDVGLRDPQVTACRLRATVLDAGKAVRTFESDALTVPAAPDPRLAFTAAWPDAKLWDPETPANVYDAVLQVVAADGRLLDESTPIRFGFREFWLDGRDFVLNGKRLHLRALHVTNLNDTADRACLEGSRQTCRRLLEYGFNFLITGNYNFGPGEVGYMDGLLEATDEAGVLVSFSLPHGGDFNWKLDTPAQAERYRTLCEWLVRRVQNHPSVVLYAMNHNATGYHGDQNPLKIDGLYDADAAMARASAAEKSWSSRTRPQARIAEGIAKALDPTRPVYHHQSGNLGDLHSVNIYLNWAPRQERSDWLEHWATTGAKPVFFVEWGLPHISSWSSYRGPEFIWRCQAFQQVWDSEFAAAHVGDAAYRMTPTKQKSLAYEESLWAKGTPFAWGDLNRYLHGTEECYLEVLTAFADENWRAHRAWGVSAMLPWDQGEFWVRTQPTPSRDNPAAFTDLQQPGIVPDRFLASGQYISDPGPADAFRPTSIGRAMQRGNRALAAFIGGGERFTGREHNQLPGDTVQRQIVVLNDTRQPVTAACTWELGAGLARGTAAVALEPGGKALVPVRAALPANQPPGALPLHVTCDFGNGRTDEHTVQVHVLAPPPTPAPARRLGVFDPPGRTTALLRSLGVPFDAVQPGSVPGNVGVLVIGREALADGVALPDVRRVRDGLSVLVFEQPAEVLTDRLGFRINVHGLRNVFARVADHPALRGLTEEHLRDWQGAATLVPPYLDVPEYETTDPTWTWCGFRNTRVWRCGLHGAVATVLIEKPERGNWLPIVDGGFDLQYAPLLEYTEGTGRVIFCQLDVTGRTTDDPAARTLVANLLAYLGTPPPPLPSRPVLYAGDAVGADCLARLGVAAAPLGAVVPPAAALLVLGPGAGQVDAVRQALAAGRDAVGLGLTLDDLRQLAPAAQAEERELGSDLAADLTAPEWRGLASADLHWRTRLKLAVPGGTPAPAPWLTAVQTGQGRLTLCQAPPWVFDTQAKPYVRTSQRRSLFLISRWLANLGATATSPLLDRLAQPPAPYTVPLTEGWVGEVDREDVGRAREWWQPGLDDSAWKPIRVPGTFESQRPELAEYNGVFWYRLRFRLPAGLRRTDLRLELGPVDDESWVWLNGEFLGEVTKQTNPKDYWQAPRTHPLPPERLRWDGENVLAVRVNDTYQSGGLGGRPQLQATPPWLDSHYVQVPEAGDDPYRYYRW